MVSPAVWAMRLVTVVGASSLAGFFVPMDQPSRGESTAGPINHSLVSCTI